MKETSFAKIYKTFFEKGNLWGLAPRKEVGNYVKGLSESLVAYLGNFCVIENCYTTKSQDALFIDFTFKGRKYSLVNHLNLRGPWEYPKLMSPILCIYPYKHLASLRYIPVMHNMGTTEDINLFYALDSLHREIDTLEGSST